MLVSLRTYPALSRVSRKRTAVEDVNPEARAISLTVDWRRLLTTFKTFRARSTALTGLYEGIVRPLVDIASRCRVCRRQELSVRTAIAPRGERRKFQSRDAARWLCGSSHR
ncbi:hypothetical protein MPLDJ20_20181 [Mesorhizobium plurifarium]|uniref:Uncharacterized protein n=1 Tax=Mesorhizobium plurifarium TaxID=69974 RepID=A0A090EVA4_MESPL|nr:hypothetical protein MPLDJ20_20181 [Mesorhizobium plurifarium]